jgi:multiple sugar transport system substrate-binding protein
VGFLTSTSAQIELNKTFGTLPVVHAAYDAPEFADPALVTFGRILAKHAEAMPMVPSERQMEQVLGAAVRDLVADGVRGEVSDAEIAAALHRAERQMAAP